MKVIRGRKGDLLVLLSVVMAGSGSALAAPAATRLRVSAPGQGSGCHVRPSGRRWWSSGSRAAPAPVYRPAPAP